MKSPARQPMSDRTAPRRESGMALLFSIVMILLLFSIAGVMVSMARTEARAVIEGVERDAAFYLAEAGVEAAKWEIAEDLDPDANGVGNTTVTTSVGTYEVLAVDLGGGNYQLTSTGSHGATDITLQVVLTLAVDTRFPRGAFSVVGNVADLDIDIEEDANLVLDGGSSPALSFSDPTVYQRVGDDFAKAINDTSFPAINLKGSPLQPFGSPVQNLPIAQSTGYDSALTDLTALYNDLKNKAIALKSTATTVTAPFSPTYGTPTSPVTIYVPTLELLDGMNVTGYGTLIVGDELTIGSTGSLNWTGDVFVVGDELAGNDADLRVKGDLTVAGNLVLLGEGAMDSGLRIDSAGQATVNGSLFVGADWANQAGTKAEVRVDGGSLTVNGVMTMVGAEVELEVDELSVGNACLINGMLQIAIPPAVETELVLELEGAFEVLLNPQNIEAGMAALRDLGVKYNLQSVGDIFTSDVSVTAWNRVQQ